MMRGFHLSGRSLPWAGRFLVLLGAALAVGGLHAEAWPPIIDPTDKNPIPVPYLEETNIPAVISIDVGRQLFVDDYLIAATSGLVKTFYKPTKLACNPLFFPETPEERALTTTLGDRPYPPGKRPRWDAREKTAPACAMPGGGVWWDAKRKVFRLWYLAGWSGFFATAESADGIHWTRPAVGPTGTNVLLPDQKMDTFSVWPDYAAADPYSAWKLYISPGGNPNNGYEYCSKDGYQWKLVARTGENGDSSTLFYNPFRGKWVWSIRAYWRSRSRMYHEHEDFVKGASWYNPVVKKRKASGADPLAAGGVVSNSTDCVRWLACDNRDRPKSGLYNVDATPYESLTVGLFKIICGRDNGESARYGMPKTTTIHFAYSRDGFHFSRPDRTPAIPDSGWGSGQWDSGYLGPCSSGFVIKDERLWFFYTGVRGDATEINPPVCTLANGMHCNMSIGAATLRRDGFAGLVADGRGEVVTRPVRFTGSHLFVNAEVRFGSLAAEVLDESGTPIEGFAAADCLPLVRQDTTRAEIRWKGGDLARLAGKRVKFRFFLKVGTLYSFWVSPSERGESRGYLAAGGPAYGGFRDL